MHKCITYGCNNTLSYNQWNDMNLCKVCMKDDNMVPDTERGIMRLVIPQAIPFCWQVATVMLRVYLRSGKVGDEWAAALEITLMKHFDWVMGYMLKIPLSAIDVEQYRIQDLIHFFRRGPASRRPTKRLYEKRTTCWKRTSMSRCVYCASQRRFCECSDEYEH